MISGELLALDPVIPIATVARAEDAVPLARAVQKGGLRTLEVTLSTPSLWRQSKGSSPRCRT